MRQLRPAPPTTNDAQAATNRLGVALCRAVLAEAKQHPPTAEPEDPDECPIPF